MDRLYLFVALTSLLCSLMTEIVQTKVGNYVLTIFGLITSFELISFSPIKISTISLVV